MSTHNIGFKCQIRILEHEKYTLSGALYYVSVQNIKIHVRMFPWFIVLNSFLIKLLHFFYSLLGFILNLFIFHRLRNKLSAYINHARGLIPGDFTNTRSVFGKSAEPGTFGKRGRGSIIAPLSSTNR